jgi:hypothetical protein
MIRTTSILGYLVLAAVGAQGLGCATASTGPTLRDAHASTALGPDASRLVVAGPAVLLHLDVEGRGEVSLYTAARITGKDVDCMGAGTSGRQRLVAGVSNHVNLRIAPGEVACITSETPGSPGSPTARGGLQIAWHAQAATPQGSAAPAGMSLTMNSPRRIP